MGRRTETTEYLKECMSDALIEKLKETSLDKIGLKEITDIAGVGRVTFYRHFNDKTELITFKLNSLWERWNNDHPIPSAKGPSAESRWFFDFFYSNRELLSLLYRRNQLSLAYDFILNLFEESKLKNTIFSDSENESRFAISFLTYGILGVLIEWIKCDFLQSTEEMLEMFDKFSHQII